jgi:hypothetical protein
VAPVPAVPARVLPDVRRRADERGRGAGVARVAGRPAPPHDHAVGRGRVGVARRGGRARPGGARGAPAPDPAALRAAAGRTLNQLWRASHRASAAPPAAAPAARGSSGGPTPVLQEVLYGEGPDAATLARARARLDAGLASLAGLGALWAVLRRPGADVRLPLRFFRFRIADARADGQPSVRRAPGTAAGPTVRRAPGRSVRHRRARGGRVLRRPGPRVPRGAGRPRHALHGRGVQIGVGRRRHRPGADLRPRRAGRAQAPASARRGRLPRGRCRAGWGCERRRTARGRGLRSRPRRSGDAEERVRSAAAAMAGPPRADAYPATTDPAKCARCEFRAVCHPTRYPLVPGWGEP